LEQPILIRKQSKINKYCGGHSASIILQNDTVAQEFMENVDTAAVYHNASTRFTDGGQFGLGGELAISTDKLHQRIGGLQHLVTNKWYIYGEDRLGRLHCSVFSNQFKVFTE
jgi:glutamate-5-semialdehyde dehydrogenase